MQAGGSVSRVLLVVCAQTHVLQIIHLLRCVDAMLQQLLLLLLWCFHSFCDRPPAGTVDLFQSERQTHSETERRYGRRCVRRHVIRFELFCTHALRKAVVTCEMKLLHRSCKKILAERARCDSRPWFHA